MLNNINVSGLSEMAQEVAAMPKEGVAKYGVELNWVSGTRMHVKTLSMQLGDYTLARNFEFEIDEPQQLGGINCAANPQEYLLAGVASCIGVTFMAGATANKVAIDTLKITVRGNLDLACFLGLNQTKHAGCQELNLDLEVKGNADQETFEKILNNVKKYSPNFNNMENEVKIVPNLIVK